MKIRMREVVQFLINTDKRLVRWDILVANNKSLSEVIDNTGRQCGESCRQFFYIDHHIRDPGAVEFPSEELLAARQLAAESFAKMIEDHNLDPDRARNQCLPRAVEWAQMIEVSHG